MATEIQQPTYDVIIFGASGFTGKYVVREALKFLNTPNSPLKTLAVAGRSSSKLTETLKWASNSHPAIPIVIADTSDPQSLRRMASQTRLVLSCVGPYRDYGDPVVAACVEVGCDYLDICGEPDFMERMEHVYHDKAVEMCSLVVTACGSVSVAAELGFMFNSMQWVGDSVPNRVETYLSLESDKRIVGNYTTLESMVLSMTNVDKLIKLRQPGRKGTRPTIPGSAPKSQGTAIVHQPKIGLYGVKLPSADVTVVRRTLSTHADSPNGLQGVNEDPKQAEKRAAFWSKIKPAHFGVKIGAKNLLGIFRIIAIGRSIGYLSRFPLGRWLLLAFPSIFCLGVFRKNSGPTEDEIESQIFKLWFMSYGFKDKNRVSGEPDVEIITRIIGPELGYLATSAIMIQCALIVLKQRQDFPKGGVFPPGIVFGPTNLQNQLRENGFSFDVISRSEM